MQVMVLFSIHPLDKGAHVGPWVARAVRIIRASGLEHELGPSGTTILGDWDAVFACIRACHEDLARDCVRVSSLVKVDQMAFGPGSIREKVARTEARLGPESARGSA
jgi:uncharacterized protein (TIGR00106 family)